MQKNYITEPTNNQKYEILRNLAMECYSLQFFSGLKVQLFNRNQI
jgi:hypothetical protein